MTQTETIMPTSTPHTFARQVKIDLCRQIQNGQKRPAQLCHEHEITEGLLLRWRREFDLRGEAAFLPKERPKPRRRLFWSRR